jgi:RNase adaptor protein for sRNA GlmZ degradation
MDHRLTRPNVRVLITSYGVLHGAAPEPQHPARPVEVDLADTLRNPHDDPGMRYRTGFDPDVYQHVMETPGAVDYRDEAVKDILVRRMLGIETIEVFVYCRGGRHRSVAMAEAIRHELQAEGIDAVHHARDVGKPVVQAIPSSTNTKAA